jgi:structure-specific endonuclease subunit SLX1
MDIKPMPAFYCCYLLRSTVRHASLYVGSTPHPARRLAQHNGKVKGGAVRTSRNSLRPWEMTCIVAGFPSNTAALQFEWAWQNPDLTRHILSDERISFATARTEASSRTGQMPNRPGRPQTSLIDKLSNLHLLLRVPYFSRWPLEVRFFNKDVFRTWQTWVERVDQNIRSGIKVFLDLPRSPNNLHEVTSTQPLSKRRKFNMIGNGGVEGVDPTYTRLQDVLDKSKFILDDDEDLACEICREPLSIDTDIFTICPHNNCRSLSHVTCLSKNFLQQEQSAELLPVSGNCPTCKINTSWSDLMCQVSLRSRGEKEINKLLSKKRRTQAVTAVEIMESESDDDEDALGGLTAEDVVDEEADDDDDDAMSVVSTNSYPTTKSRLEPGVRNGNTMNRLEIVIEDSDDDMAEDCDNEARR